MPGREVKGARAGMGWGGEGGPHTLPPSCSPHPTPPRCLAPPQTRSVSSHIGFSRRPQKGGLHPPLWARPCSRCHPPPYPFHHLTGSSPYLLVFAWPVSLQQTAPPSRSPDSPRAERFVPCFLLYSQHLEPCPAHSRCSGKCRMHSLSHSLSPTPFEAPGC